MAQCHHPKTPSAQLQQDTVHRNIPRGCAKARPNPATAPRSPVPPPPCATFPCHPQPLVSPVCSLMTHLPVRSFSHPVTPLLLPPTLPPGSCDNSSCPLPCPLSRDVQPRAGNTHSGTPPNPCSPLSRPRGEGHGVTAGYSRGWDIQVREHLENQRDGDPDCSTGHREVSELPFKTTKKGQC